MYRCANCDTPAQFSCECAEVQEFNQHVEQDDSEKINIASGEDVVLEPA